MKGAMAGGVCLAFFSSGIAVAQDCAEKIPTNLTWPQLHKCLENIMKLRNEVNMLRAQLEDIKARLGNIEHLMEARFAYSFQFKGLEFNNGVRHINRVYFYATRDHDVKMSLYMTRDASSERAQFLLNLIVDGNGVGTIIRDSLETINIPPRVLYHQSTRDFLDTPDETSPRPAGLHYLELKAARQFQMDPKDFFEASGIIHVTRKTK
jgi:hypothetical protein